MLRGAGGLLLLLIVYGYSLSGELSLCIQVAADRSFETLKSYYKRVKDFPEARIEKRGDIYLLRVGKENSRKNLQLMLRKIRRFFPDAFIKKCEIDPGIVVYPSKKKEVKENLTEKKEEDEDRLKDELIRAMESSFGRIESRIERIEGRVNSLSKSISAKENRSQSLDPSVLEKFLLSVGIFVGGLFLTTWILMLWIYKRINRKIKKDVEFAGEILNLLRVINLLSKGKTIKMEDGRLMFLDKEGKWKEAE